MNNQQKAYELKQTGLTYREVAKEMGLVSDESARSMARRYSGKKKAESITTETSRFAVIDAAARALGLSSVELKTIASSGRHKVTPPSQFSGLIKGRKHKTMKVGVLTDTHIGHCKFNEELFAKCAEEFEDCDIILHAGDHLEGMSGRGGHVYELSHVGYQAQFNRALELYSLFGKTPIYGIDGNHDQWFKQKNDIGIIVGENLQSALPNYTHLGEWEGDLKIDGLWIKLFHGNDGTAYANSYKGQQLVNSLSGGEKPHAIFQGHYHKALYQFTRNVHMFDGGTICGQSQFMRGKKLAAHQGFWTVLFEWDASGVNSVTSKFTAGYE